MRWALILMGGFTAGATVYLLVYESWRNTLGLVVAGACIAIGCVLLVAAEEGA